MSHNIEFANFLCHFGREKVLLNYLEEIVLPAFTDDTLVRTRGRETPTHYHLYEVAVGILERREVPIVGVFGQFVKDVKLIRTQIYDPSKGLIEDHSDMDSSPSAYFCLVLNNHQLMYLPKTPYAPSLGEFRTTIYSFIKSKHKDYINQIYKAARAEKRKIKKSELYQQNPLPTVEIVPLTSSESISSFVARFKVLKTIEFRLIRPNPTVAASDVFPALRETLAKLNGKNNKVVANNLEGLDKEEAIIVIGGATEGGDSEVTLKGNAPDGAILNGTNDDFKMKMPLTTLPATLGEVVKRMWEAFKAAVAPIVPTAAEAEADSDARVKRLAERL